MWKTGKPWTELALAKSNELTPAHRAVERELRTKLRHRNGLRTRWTTEGLHCEFKDLANGVMTHMTTSRRKQNGAFMCPALGQILLATLEMWNAQGQRQVWRDYKPLIPSVKNKNIADLIEVSYRSKGEVVFKPTAHSMPMQSGVAHLFRDFSLTLLAAYPEVVFPS